MLLLKWKLLLNQVCWSTICNLMLAVHNLFIIDKSSDESQALLLNLEGGEMLRKVSKSTFEMTIEIVQKIFSLIVIIDSTYTCTCVIFVILFFIAFYRVLFITLMEVQQIMLLLRVLLYSLTC